MTFHSHAPQKTCHICGHPLAPQKTCRICGHRTFSMNLCGRDGCDLRDRAYVSSLHDHCMQGCLCTRGGCYDETIPAEDSHG